MARDPAGDGGEISIHARPLRPRHPARLACAYAAEISSYETPRRIGDGTDGRFGLALYLAAQVRGHRLWAYNLAHLDVLAAWLGASLRERPTRGVPRNRTMMSRLPPWMSSAAARPEVVKALAQCRERAVSECLSQSGS